MGREQKVGWVKSWRGSERSSSREKKYDQSVLYKKIKVKNKNFYNVHAIKFNLNILIYVNYKTDIKLWLTIVWQINFPKRIRHFIRQHTSNSTNS